MPASPSPGDRLAMEEALGSELMRAVHAQCRAFPIPIDRWHRVPQIARAWEVTAATIVAGRFRSERGIGAKSAVDAAAIHLGLEPDTIHSRLKRGHSDAWRPAV